MTRLSKAEEVIYALLRLIAGALFACHGAQKVLGFFPSHQPGMSAVMGYEGAQDLLDGVLIRPRVTLFGLLAMILGVLIAVGLFSRVAGFLASAEMAINFLIFHVHWPILNHGELAVLFCLFFLYVGVRGSGRFRTLPIT